MLVLDANILIRAALGSRVLSLLRKYAEHVEFVAPDTAFREAREELPSILERRKVPVAPAMAPRILWPDTDFFGCGVATWTPDHVEFYLEEVSS